MEYIYLLHYETDALGIVWSKAFRGQLLHNGNDFKSGDQDMVMLRHGKLYIQEFLIETE